MPKPTMPDAEKVDQYIQNLEPALAKTVDAIRQIILASSKLVDQQIKWNSPSFYYSGKMKDFDPKEYKRDIAVLNLHKGRILLVLPTGAKIADSTGLLEGAYKDGRRLITFKDLADVQSKQSQLKKIIKDWIRLVDKD